MGNECAEQLSLEMTVAAADRGFHSIDRYATWFVGGTAAGVGILLANLDKISEFISAATLGVVLDRVTIAFAVTLVSKYLGALISTQAGALEAVREITGIWTERELPFPTSEEFADAQMRSRPLVLQLIAKLRGPAAADKTRIARSTLNRLMIASFLNLIAMGLIATAWIEVAASL